MDKYNRNYVLEIQKRDGTTLTVKRPFTIQFDIHRNSLSSANVCSIRVYNLSPTNRDQVRKDQFDYGDLRSIALRAGYGDNLSLAFAGNISQAWSIREGTDFVTQIESYDGGFAYINAITDSQFPDGSQQSSIIGSLVDQLDQTGVTKGAIGSFPGEISRGNSYSGSTCDILRDITGQSFFIDNNKANCIGDNECIESSIPLVNAKSGLLGTPLKENQYINFEMLFEPSLIIAQLINLQSETANHFNGVHKVISIQHRGTISEAICGDAITSVGLLSGTEGPGANGFVPVPSGG